MARRSDNVTKGIEKAPMRSLFYAMGYTKEELERPLIGVVSAHSEIVPGHINLDKITDCLLYTSLPSSQNQRRYLPYNGWLIPAGHEY